MASNYNVGDAVKWKWGDGMAHGEITERFTDKTTRTIKGTEITRDASDDDPAYLIKQADGDQVLKSHSEIEKDG